MIRSLVAAIFPFSTLILCGESGQLPFSNGAQRERFDSNGLPTLAFLISTNQAKQRITIILIAFWNFGMNARFNRVVSRPTQK